MQGSPLHFENQKDSPLHFENQKDLLIRQGQALPLQWFEVLRKGIFVGAGLAPAFRKSKGFAPAFRKSKGFAPAFRKSKGLANNLPGDFNSLTLSLANFQ